MPITSPDSASPSRLLDGQVDVQRTHLNETPKWRWCSKFSGAMTEHQRGTFTHSLQRVTRSFCRARPRHAVTLTNTSLTSSSASVYCFPPFGGGQVSSQKYLHHTPVFRKCSHSDGDRARIWADNVHADVGRSLSRRDKPLKRISLGRVALRRARESTRLGQR